MKPLTTLSFETNKLVLSDHHVTSPVLPRTSSEMGRDIEVAGECLVDGALYAHNLTVVQGPMEIKGACMAGNDLFVQAGVGQPVVFRKAVASGGSVVAVPEKGRCYFGADLNGSTVRLRNAFVAANVFGSEVVLEDCVVLGGIFATKSLSLRNCVLGTCNAPRVSLAGRIHFLMPSAFSIEPFDCAPGLIIENLTLADLGSLMRGLPEAEKSGRIVLNPLLDGQKTTLSDGSGNQTQIHTYSVAAKVLAADLLDMEKLQNHFLLHAGMMGPQLLRNYELGLDKDGAVVELTQTRIADFFFRILSGEIMARIIEGRFSIGEVARAYQEN